ncbi:MAG TPA: hypothetical protein VF173_30970 [Thermoanaerobaculia bacterium]|nr:hypothetical protein [Thermoanaerobaculia bacterium]
MATINSLADVALDWQTVLSGCQDNADLMKIVEPLRAELEKQLGALTDINARKQSAIGLKQQLTQEMGEVLTAGRELARRLRGAAKAQLGTKSERLVQFKTAPVRDRKGRRSKAAKKPPVTPVPAPAATHETKSQE